MCARLKTYWQRYLSHNHNGFRIKSGTRGDQEVGLSHHQMIQSCHATDLTSELLKYKEFYLKYFDRIGFSKRKAVSIFSKRVEVNVVDYWPKFKALIQEEQISPECKVFLEKFGLDNEWTGCTKGIGRDDFFYSSVCHALETNPTNQPMMATVSKDFISNEQLKSIRDVILKDNQAAGLKYENSFASLHSELSVALNSTGFVEPRVPRECAAPEKGHEEIKRNFIISLATKPFVILTGNSGTGKTKLAELFAQWLCGKDSKDYILVPVGSDWTDNRNVLGFVNHLRKATDESNALPVYQSTPILDLILRAVDAPQRPHFLILDEMNLSHVERYFADFLSAMESQTGELFLHSLAEGQARLPTEAGGEPRVLGKVRLPGNLFVVGTVNVDETTYMFSPKVLDRANVLEFRTGQGALESYFEAGGKGLKEIPRAAAMTGQVFLDLSRQAREGRLPEIPALERVQASIKGVFEIMEAERLEFGFRTVREILCYHRVDYATAERPAEWNWEPVFDDQILQKILPKLGGSKRRVEALLVRLARYCETGVVPKKEDSTPADYQTSPVKRDKSAKPKFSRSHDKLCDMLDTVRRDQFVSFIH